MTNIFTLTNVACLDAAKSSHPISTGIGFFDHMIDQLNSHAQIGVSVTVHASRCGAESNNSSITNGCSTKDVMMQTTYDIVNRYAAEDQSEIMAMVGTALGDELKRLNYSTTTEGGCNELTSRFCCPLDEALVECTLTKHITSHTTEGVGGRLVNFTLPPYGKYPTKQGRSKIGSMQTQHVETFFVNLAQSSGINISLVKVRGDNGHHVVESAFKAFARALRNLIDGTNTNNYTSAEYKRMWGLESQSYSSSLDLCREGKLERCTKETSILVRILMDGLAKGSEDSIVVKTGINTIDQFISVLAREANMSVEVKCKGDLYVDDHHTSEDVSIALGQVLNSALGTKAGLNRMWCAVGNFGGTLHCVLSDLLLSNVVVRSQEVMPLRPFHFRSYTCLDAEVEITMDLSNRPCLVHNLSLSSNPNEEEYAGDVSVEMLDHVLESLVMNSMSTVHIVEKKLGSNVLETALATAVAFGRALKMCAAVDPRRAGQIASSKGTLSV